MKKRWILYFIGWLLGTTAYSQSLAPNVINSAGASATVSGNVHEWSIGEMVLVSTETAGTGTITQGVLQPIYTDHTSINEETSGLQENLIMYPNPTSGEIYLQPTLAAGSKLELRLVDLTGKILSQKEVWLYSGNETQYFNLNGFAAGMCLLQVQWTQENRTKTSVYKIEKN